MTNAFVVQSLANALGNALGNCQFVVDNCLLDTSELTSPSWVFITRYAGIEVVYFEKGENTQIK